MRIDDLRKIMVSNIPDVLLDLLEVAAYVYCADQQASRGSEYLMDYGADWRREMIFRIPVRSPGVWQRQEVRECLAEMLGFLSDEHYTFEFVEAKFPLAKMDAYFSDLADGAEKPDEIALFSGGIDSFAGALEAQAIGKKTVLVGHYPRQHGEIYREGIAHFVVWDALLRGDQALIAAQPGAAGIRVSED